MYCVLAVGIAAVSSMAPAADGKLTYGWCEVKGSDGNYLMSELLQAPSGPNDALEREFAASMGGDQRASCWMYYSRPTEADSYLDKRKYVIETEEKLKYSLTGWTGSHGIRGEPPKSQPGAYLTVEKAGPTPAEAAAERAGRELEGQRAAAAANAKRIADAARSQAETQAKIDKFMAELKKRGSAQ
jgi:hypothetical protein